MTDERFIQHRTAEANRLLQEPLLLEAIAEIEAQTINELTELHFWETRKQRMLLDRIRVVRGIQSHIETVALAGSFAARRKLSVA